MVENNRIAAPQVAVSPGIVRGRTEGARVLVEIQGRPAPVPCRLVVTKMQGSPAPKMGDEVLIALDPCEESGYILGFLQGRVGETPEHHTSVPLEETDGKVAIGALKPPAKITVNGKSISIEATDEIHIKCGRSSIDLHRDGKVVIRGTHLVSRSSGLNKIKGAAVGIN